MKKKFVYSLVDEKGYVFYIGCTDNIKIRYAFHISNYDANTATTKYIQEVIQRGFFPDLNIIDYLPAEEAIRAEAEIIRTFGKAGHKLTNYQNSWAPLTSRHISIKDANTKKKAIKIIKYKQDVHNFHHNNRDENGKQIIYQYPEIPQL